MFTGRVWRGIAPVMAIGLGLVASDIVQAAPGRAACRSIEAQLARGGGASTNRKYSAAAERQRREIGKIRGQMAAAGCGFFNASPRCANLSRMASKMSANLSSLSAKAGSKPGRSRASLIAALEANDCRGKRKNVVVASREDGPSIITRLFGEPQRRRTVETPLAFWRQQDSHEPAIRKVERRNSSGGRDRIVREAATPSASSQSPGSYRTFCVRTCDGYYFPMSPASSKDDMARDEKNCQAACPGAETTLYYHKDEQEDAEAMISRATGKNYEKLKTAFVYREASTLQSPQCSCGARPGALKLVSTEPEAPTKSKKSVPLPVNRPDPVADPETLANAEGGLTAEALRQLLSRGGSQMVERDVRVVGPVFLPDPAAAKAPPVPAPTATR